MKRIDFLKLSGILLISLASSLYTKAESIASDTETKAVNVILFIGDGMSLAQWQTGMVMSDTPLNIERMRSVGIVRTNSSTDFNGDGPSHGTAIASGINTRKGAVGLDANDKPVKTIIEYASEQGVATGIVSANTLAEGSIAPFVAHLKSRMRTEDIALAYVEQAPDLFIGGGKRSFSHRKDGRNLVEELEKKGYRIAQSIAETQNARGEKLVGFLSDSIMPDIAHGRGDMFPESVRSAIQFLDRLDRNFFLLVGDMFVDRASHAGNTELVGRETIDLDKAIGVALDFAEKDGNTLVVVVGGPEASGMTLVGGDIDNKEVVAKWTMPGMIHTGTMVPVFSFGVGSENFQGMMKNTDLFFRVKALLLGEKPSHIVR